MDAVALWHGGTFLAASQKSTGTIEVCRAEAGLHGPCGRRGTGECGILSGPPSSQLIMAASVEAGTMPSSCVSLRLLLKEFPTLRSRGSHVKSGALFRWSLCVAVLVPCVWALLMSTEDWIFREILTFLRGMLGSTVDTCSCVSTLAYGQYFTHFLRWRQT